MYLLLRSISSCVFSRNSAVSSFADIIGKRRALTSLRESDRPSISLGVSLCPSLRHPTLWCLAPQQRSPPPSVCRPRALCFLPVFWTSPPRPHASSRVLTFRPLFPLIKRAQRGGYRDEWTLFPVSLSSLKYRIICLSLTPEVFGGREKALVCLWL